LEPSGPESGNLGEKERKSEKTPPMKVTVAVVAIPSLMQPRARNARGNVRKKNLVGLMVMPPG
jgi:hypothetical protein